VTAGLPLDGVRVLDLSSLLPGPLATLLLAQAGADVIKVERPGQGDEMRGYEPKLGAASANYAVLNGGKRAVAIDLKSADGLSRVLDLARGADVVVEQFRPGVADRLGVGYQAVRAVNEDIVYCSITGFGATGRRAASAGHDLTYLAESGLLRVVGDTTGSPVPPFSVIADIAGGTYPALINILLALQRRDRWGVGDHLVISMTHNLQVFSYGYFATYQVTGQWPEPNRELLTGGSPRYRFYRTADGGYLACAALEDRFWRRLLEILELPEYEDERGREDEAAAAVAAVFASRTAEHWQSLLIDEDVCVAVVATLDEAVAYGLLVVDGPDRVSDGDASIPTLQTPVSATLRRAPATSRSPELEPPGRVDWL
jgi:alpha-methylacyl-CoA racemase